MTVVSDERGFSLPEALAGLAIFGMAVVVASSFLSAQAAAERRLAGRQELLRLAEAGLESVRGLAVPLEPTVLDDEALLEVTTLRDPAVVIDVRPTSLDGLFEVAVTVSADLRGEEVSLRVDTMVWRPLL